VNLMGWRLWSGLVALGFPYLAFAACAERVEVVSTHTPDSRYVDHGDGTVTDLMSGLMWQQCSVGQTFDATAVGAARCSGTVELRTWSEAIGLPAGDAANAPFNSYPAFANYSDWRVPNAKELQSLVALECRPPKINATLFPLATPFVGGYWSASTYARQLTEAWSIDFNYGFSAPAARGLYHAVRLVRSAW
jgi:hypothetical protein